MFQRAGGKTDHRKGGENGLERTLDVERGLSRRVQRSNFEYLDLRGKPIRDAARLSRLTALKIPPAWTDVWICPNARGHLQATGRDQRGRKQYIYHEQWQAERAALKYERILEFAGFLPRIRSRIARDLARRGLPKEKVLATVLRLMELTLVRVGNEQYARDNHSYGLTTLRDRHAEISGGKLRLRFAGKSGKWHECDVQDARLARIVERCQDLPGQQLLQYLDDAGNVHDITSADVNDYLRMITGREFSAKDFRTWAATSLAIALLCKQCEFCSVRAGKRQVVEVIDCIAKRLNNTRSVCRKSYIHPGVIEAYLDKSLPAHYQQALGHGKRGPRGLSTPEKLAMTVLNALAKLPGKSRAKTG
jgi:DNA topoisomerase I